MVFSFLVIGCGGSGDSAPVEIHTAQLNIPDNFPPPRLPDNNPITDEKITLGRFLFYDRNMSFSTTQSCGDCHEQRKGFTDGLLTSIGSENDVHPRNAMGLANVIYNGTQNWANNAILTLDSQAAAVLLNDDPIELGWVDASGNDAGRSEVIMNRFKTVQVGVLADGGDIDYPALFAAAFPDQADPYSLATFTDAVAAFVTSMISGNSEHDKETRGEPNTMSDSAKRGRDLFFTERLECFHCHGGFNFSNNFDHANNAFTTRPFFNNGLFNVGGNNDYPADNQGLFEFTADLADRGKFRPVTLRNIELTAPYMHDGSLATLDDVIEHYRRGGTLTTTGPNAGDGALNDNKSDFVGGFGISASERVDLVEFFKSLTDWDFICNEGLSDPFGNIPMHASCP